MELEEANKSKTDYAAALSHEIRTPLNAVLGFAQLLEEDESLRGQEYAKAISKAGKHLLGLVNNVLDSAKVDAGKMPLNSQPVDLVEFLQEVSTLFSFRCQEKGLLLRVSHPPVLPPVLADPLRLRQMMINLLGNAVKFTEHGEICLEGRVGDSSGGKVNVQISISDTGPGLSPATLSSLFQPFMQGPQSPLLGGTGLGLSITKKLANLMGGDVTVSSEEGVGSKFTLSVSLPLADNLPQTASVRRSRVLPEFSSLPILIVDDDEDNRKFTMAMLSELGFTVMSEASNGQEALEAISANPFVIIFLDIFMPVLNGIEAARKIRELHLPNLVIFALSASSPDKSTRSNFSSLFDHFFIKPLLLDELKGALELQFDYMFTAETFHSPFSAAPLRVLVVDDQALMRRLISVVLGRGDLHVELCNGGNEALEALSSSSYDVVLIDRLMPKMGGIETARRILSDISPPPVLFLMSSDFNKEECEEAKIDAVIDKPIRLEEFLRVWRMVEARRMPAKNGAP